MSCWKEQLHKYLNKLYSYLSSDSYFTSQPEASEVITVYATHRDDYRNDGTARHSPFMPSRKHNNTSSFRIIKLSIFKIWKIGHCYVAGKRKIYGRFDFLAQDATNVNLGYDPDNDPPRHANIISWPNNNGSIKTAALHLAARSTYHRELKNDVYRAQAWYNITAKCMVGETSINGVPFSFKSKTVNDLDQAFEQAIQSASQYCW